MSRTGKLAPGSFIVLGLSVYTAGIWAAFTALAMAVAVGIHTFGSLDDSVYNVAGGQLPRWFMFGIGIYLIRIYLPMHVGHGRTRRQFTAHALASIVLVTAAGAALMTAGYALEGLLYQGLDRPRNIPAEQTFAVDEYPLVFAAYWGAFLVWMSVGALVSTAFYRGSGTGLLTVPVAVALIILAGDITSDQNLPFDDVTAPTSMVQCLSGFLVAAGLLWALLRDIPIQTRTS
ncbi:hypothetical protein DPM19_09430 [Actinomadura craniellae]|uniref:Uncharacterized protein n=1 Tax=Actinomadura craniellae TaxID=2231787 RepID=A0A365HAA5_9ACTN|nr:hypothetical protein [Actinomadura craniellae]RAY15959.1 hypothetical protein DPM19_09430 [Actinomadura craniellae]